VIKVKNVHEFDQKDLTSFFSISFFAISDFFTSVENSTRHSDIRHNGTQHNDIQHIGLCLSHSASTFVILSSVMLSVAFFYGATKVSVALVTVSVIMPLC
jgi:hypothetical protein